jgi:thiamine-phosphate pyrophosphorylase
LAGKNQIYRILDANLNRLREALRVIEEYYRFIDERPVVCVELKKARHTLIEMEAKLGREALLGHRDTDGDCFAGETRPEERARAGLAGLLAANFKRGQEACRVIEEYAKVAVGESDSTSVAESAKAARFTLYKFEKELLGGKRNGTGKKRK